MVFFSFLLLSILSFLIGHGAMSGVGVVFVIVEGDTSSPLLFLEGAFCWVLGVASGCVVLAFCLRGCFDPAGLVCLHTYLTCIDI